MSRMIDPAFDDIVTEEDKIRKTNGTFLCIVVKFIDN